MTHADTFLTGHPSDEQLDRLRAELYDDAPRMRDALRAHVAGCEQCRARARIWERTTAALGALDAPGVASALRARRRQAQQGRPAPRWIVPRWTQALAAGVLAVAIGLGTCYYLHGTDSDAVTAANDQSDIYADIDFYLWLIQEQPGDDSESS